VSSEANAAGAVHATETGGASRTVGCGSTASGPSSEATVASSGSAALWQEHTRDGALSLAAPFPLCIGHTAPVSWRHSHDAFAEGPGSAEHSVVGTDTSSDRWTDSHAAATPAARVLSHCMTDTLPQRLGVPGLR
jgi:hypothetical protein